MGSPRIITKPLTLTAAGGAAPSGRVWDAPCGMPFSDVTIYLSSLGATTAAGNMGWEVFLGGVWSGTPFDADSTHTGGISQGSGVIAGGTELAHMIHEDTSLFPTNLRSVRPAPGGTDIGIGGFPVVVELTNAKAVAITVYVTFVSRTVSDMF